MEPSARPFTEKPTEQRFQVAKDDQVWWSATALAWFGYRRVQAAVPLENASVIGHSGSTIPLFYSLRLNDSTVSTGLCIRTLARHHRPVCKCGLPADFLHEEVCSRASQVGRHNNVRDVIAKYLRRIPNTDVHVEPGTSEGGRRSVIGLRGPGGSGRRDVDYDLKIYSAEASTASLSGLDRRRPSGDTVDLNDFSREQCQKWLAFVSRRAERNKPDSRVDFEPLVLSSGGLMHDNTVKEFGMWRGDMEAQSEGSFTRMLEAINISLLIARTIHRNHCLLLCNRVEEEDVVAWKG
ncbi:hypothetical protein P7C73_g4779, partial [Tremellales sp. Uapishka_1]